jgi:amino acid permease
MYVFYLALEIVNTLSVFSIADEHTRKWIERAGWVLLGLPLYRFIVFHFRFSGFLVTLTEEQKWTMDGPMSTAANDLLRVRSRSIEFVTSLVTFVQMSAGLLLRISQAIAGPLVIALSITLLRWFESWRKAS